MWQPFSDHTLTNVEKIVLPIVACIGSVLLGVLLCVYLRKLPYRGYSQMDEIDNGGGGGVGYALGTGEAVQGTSRFRTSAAPTAAAQQSRGGLSNLRGGFGSGAAAAQSQAGGTSGAGTVRQTGTRLGSGANVHGFSSH